MKKELKIALSVLLALVVFLGGVIVGSTNGLVQVNVAEAQQSGATQAPVTQAPATQAPVTQAPATQAPTQAPATQAPTEAPTQAPQGGDTTTAPSATEAPTQAPSGTAVPSTPEEVCAAYNKAINEYKQFKGTVTLHKVENTQVNITDLPSVAKPLEGTLNDVIGGIVKPVDETFTFSNGIDQNDPARYIDHKMIPGGREAKVTTADVSSATATPNADGGYTITLQFVSETSSYDGTNTTDPVHHMAAMDPLNLATINADPIKITSAEMTYPGATTSITVDSQGRLVKLVNKLPLEGKGTGGLGPIKATIGLAGQMDSEYTMQYA